MIRNLLKSSLSSSWTGRSFDTSSMIRLKRASCHKLRSTELRRVRLKILSVWGISAGVVAGVCSSIKLWSDSCIVKANEPMSLLDLDSIKLQVKHDKELTWEKMSMKAALTVSGSVSNLVEVIASRWIESETLYHKYLEILIELMAAFISAIGTPDADELWSSLMFVRGYLAEIKEERRQVHLLWNNCCSLAENAGQTAFLTGADFSGCRLGELMPVAETDVTRLSAITHDLELRLAKLEAEEIRKSSQHQQQAHNSGQSGDTHEIISLEDSDDLELPTEHNNDGS